MEDNIPISASFARVPFVNRSSCHGLKEHSVFTHLVFTRMELSFCLWREPSFMEETPNSRSTGWDAVLDCYFFGSQTTRTRADLVDSIPQVRGEIQALGRKLGNSIDGIIILILLAFWSTSSISPSGRSGKGWYLCHLNLALTVLLPSGAPCCILRWL